MNNETLIVAIILLPWYL